MAQFQNADPASVSLMAEISPRSASANEVSDEGVGEEATIYEHRFSPDEDERRRITWKVLCEEFLQGFVRADDIVIDIGAGDGHFLKNIQAGRKIAVDLSAHAAKLREHGITVLTIPATRLTEDFSEKADVVFMSNFLEHLPNKRIMLDVLKQCRAVLKPGGSLLVLQPNIRYVGNAYWDYIDHHIALTEFSLTEALETSGFQVQRLIPRFLPYTAKSPWMNLFPLSILTSVVSWYLRLPVLWRFFGKQTFVIATPISQPTPQRP